MRGCSDVTLWYLNLVRAFLGKVATQESTHALEGSAMLAVAEPDPRGPDK